MLKRLVVVLFTLSLAFGDENCDHLGVLLYEDIGCEPVKVEGKACPVSFQCPNLEYGNGTCMFQGHTIKHGEGVDDNLLEFTCRTRCSCLADVKTFFCGALDCPENFGVPISSGCHRTYTPGVCCATGEKCAQVETTKSGPVLEPIPDLVICNVEGKDYKEGTQFYPSDSCLNCVCQKGFDGKFVEPFCKRMVCAEQIADSHKLIENCAPAYLRDGGRKRCCPDAYVCPEAGDNIKQISSISPKKEDSELKCKFGKQDVKLGEGIERKIEHWNKSKDVKCECILPPFLTCTEKI